MKLWMRTAVLLTFLTTSSLVFAQASFTKNSESSDHFSSYYQIDEPSQVKAADFASGQIIYMSVGQFIKSTADLLKWAFNRSDWPDPSVPYNRRKQFGNWLRDPDRGSCLNTRAEILIERSEVPVTMSPSGCTVVRGKWYDPYTGQTFTGAAKVQIDHMVPLKNAYISGASKWTHKLRCAYTNFMANDFHLMVASAQQNMSKGDRSPADWLPKNVAYHCEYLKNWLSVKLIWGLILSPREAHAIRKLIKANNCDPQLYEMTEADLQKERQAINAGMQFCR